VPPPPGGLVVYAESTKQDDNLSFMLQITGVPGQSGTATRDGSFTIPVEPGKYRLVVVDATTRATLLRSESEFHVKPGATLPARLELELAMVRVKLKPTQTGGVIAAAKLGVTIDWDKPANQNMGMVFAGFGMQHGIPLDDGRRDLILYLPNREVKLTVTSMTTMLAAKSMQQMASQPSPLGETTFTPTMGKINRVEVLVKPPPDIDN
jgi:hypothetical protein